MKVQILMIIKALLITYIVFEVQKETFMTLTVHTMCLTRCRSGLQYILYILQTTL